MESKRSRDDDRKRRRDKDKDRRRRDHRSSDKDRRDRDKRSHERTRDKDKHREKEVEKKSHVERETERKRLKVEEDELVKQRKQRLEEWRQQREKALVERKHKLEMERQELELAGESTEAIEQEQAFEAEQREHMHDADGDLEAMAGSESDEEAPERNMDDDDEVDPLDAFMAGVEKEVKVVDQKWEAKYGDGPAVPNDKNADSDSKYAAVPGVVQPLDMGQTEETTVDEEAILSFKKPEEDDDALLVAFKTRKKSKLEGVDHSTVTYEPFRRDFYIESPDISKMSLDEIKQQRSDLVDIKVRGKNCPKPILRWAHCGMSMKVLDILEQKLKFELPTPIQAQTLPILMSGRDCIGVAKTGSGKTLAYIIPMLRHVVDQRPIEEGDGPIALVLAPTRELAQQIYREATRFTKASGISAVCLYGGAAVGAQIGDLKRGCEIVIATPGRLIDILTLNGGKVTNMKRVTYLILDEADRMFDMGFEPQVTRIIDNCRPDRQTAMLSATFPRTVEMLAKKVLNKPVEIIVGGRATVCDDVFQFIEVREEETKFNRLLQLFGEFVERGAVLVFVSRQETADKLFKQLLQSGYPCATLHGGMDQADRESVTADFKSGDIGVLVATSVAARGLHIDNLNLVVNFDTPSHLEDYVHRVGRTGRAGRKGWAYTFVTPSEGHVASELIKALKQSGTEPDVDLTKLEVEFEDRKKDDKELSRLSSGFRSGGYGGKGFAFTEEETAEKNLKKKLQMLDHGDQESKEVFSEDLNRALVTYQDATKQRMEKEFQRRMTAIAERNPSLVKKEEPDATTAALAKAKAMADQISKQLKTGGVDGKEAVPPISDKPDAAIAARIAARAIQEKLGVKMEEKGDDISQLEHYSEEIIINDYPQQARWMVTRKDSLAPIMDFTKCSITTRGVFVDEKHPCPPGERPLYLSIEGSSLLMVKQTKLEIQKILSAETAQVLSKNPFSGVAAQGRYSVI